MHYFLEAYVLGSAEIAPVLLYTAVWKAAPDDLWPTFPESITETLNVELPPPSAAQGTPIDGSLMRHLALIPASEAEEFLRKLREGELELSGFHIENLPIIKMKVIPRPPVLQLDQHSEDARNAWFMAPESRSSAAPAWVETFWPVVEPSDRRTYSVPIINFLAYMRMSESGRKSLQQIVSFLEKQTGLSFSKSYAQRLGCVEHYSFLHRFVDNGFSLKRRTRIPGPHGRTSNGLVILRHGALCLERHIAHVVMRNVRDIILSELVVLPTGVTESRLIACQERFSEYEVSIYKSDGKNIVYHKHTQEARGFGMNMTLVASQHRVSDQFFSKKLSHSPALQRRAEMVSEGMRSSINIEDFSDDPWYKISSMTSEAAGGSSVRRSRTSRFFPKGGEGEVEIKEHLESLIAANNVEEVILADPFFNAPALARLFLRIPHVKHPILVITSLEDHASENLVVMLRKSQGALPKGLKIINVPRGEGQAFHDRYLYIVKTMADARVYILSNSISKAGGRWPFCIAEVDDVTARTIARYLRGLADGEDLYDDNVEGLRPVELWPCEQVAATRPRRVRRSLWEHIWFREFLARLLDSEVEGYEAQVLIAQDRGLLQCDQGRLDGVRFIRSRVLSAVEIRMPEFHSLGRVTSAILSLGEIASRSVSADTDCDSDLDISDYTRRIIEQYLTAPEANFSELVDSLCSLAGVAEAESNSSKAEAAVKLFDDGTVSLEALGGVAAFLNAQPWYTEDWGLRHCFAVFSVYHTNQFANWVDTVRLGPRAALALVSAWNELCSYRKSPELARRLVMETQGRMRRFFLALAIGTRRCPPSMSLKDLADVLTTVGISVGEQAVILLASFDGRKFNQEPDGYEDLLNVWPSRNFSRKDEDVFWKHFKNFGLRELSVLAASLRERGDGAKIEWLEKQIVKFVKGHYLELEHEHQNLSRYDIDALDLAVDAWRHSTKSRLSELLPNKKVILEAVLWLGRPFVREAHFVEWTRRVVFLSAIGYVGARMHRVNPQHPDMGRFLPVLVPEIVVPILSRLTQAHHVLADDSRIKQELVRILTGYLRDASQDESSELAAKICASAQFSPEVRSQCEPYRRNG